MQIKLESLQDLIQQLVEKNWASAESFFPPDFCQTLASECHELQKKGQLKKAAIGVGSQKNINADIRGDFIEWISESTSSPSQQTLLSFLGQLQKSLNQELYLGLHRYEAHFAFYPAETGYQKHIDNPRGQGHRRITFILYLNKNWQTADGGTLSLFDPNNPTQKIAHIAPQAGTLVLFCSDIFPHQVEVSHAPRLSITGWFRNDAL